MMANHPPIDRAAIDVAIIDVAPQQRQIIADILRRYLPDREVWAYGSRVSGHSWQYSDLDLVIMGDAALDSMTKGDLRDAFTMSRLPYIVDLKDWHHIPQGWRDEIRRSYAVIHAPDTAVGRPADGPTDGVANPA